MKVYFIILFEIFEINKMVGDFMDFTNRISLSLQISFQFYLYIGWQFYGFYNPYYTTVQISAHLCLSNPGSYWLEIYGHYNPYFTTVQFSAAAGASATSAGRLPPTTRKQQKL